MSRLKISSALLLLCATLLVVGAAPAATLYVDSSVAGPGSGTIGDPFQSIQAAIDVGPNNEIQVAGGTYFESLTLAVGTQLLGGYAPGFGARDFEVNVTVIDGQEINRCILADVGTTDFLVDGVSIVSGTANETMIGAENGGGLRVLSGATGVVSNCIFQNCRADSGGAIAVEGDGFDLLVLNCVIDDCHADDDSGAIKFDNGDSFLTVDGCIISNCSGTDDGGAVKCGDSTGPSMVFTNTLFLNNTAGDESVFEGRFGTRILNCTFVGNTAPNGDGVVVERTNSANAGVAVMDLVNNIFVGNEVGGAGNPVFFVREGAAVTNLVTTNNLAFDNIADGGPGFTLDGRLTGNGNFSGDPLFVDPLLGDYRLSVGSPAVDAGADLSADFTVDLNGDARPQGAGFDIGAYEGEVSVEPTPTPIIPAAVENWSLYDR